eukprot:2794998-Ditylum_brightwellii.AAC.1
MAGASLNSRNTKMECIRLDKQQIHMATLHVHTTCDTTKRCDRSLDVIRTGASVNISSTESTIRLPTIM